jgi:hypothetical protein
VPAAGGGGPACRPADHRGHGERVIAPPPPLDVTAATGPRCRHARRRGCSGYRGGSGPGGGLSVRGYPGSTMKPGSTTIIRDRKRQKGQKGKGGALRPRGAPQPGAPQQPSPADGAGGTRTPAKTRAIPARKWQPTQKRGL